MEIAKKPAHCGHPSLGAFILLGTTGSVGLNSKSASGAPSVARLTEDDYQFSYNGIILMVFILWRNQWIPDWSCEPLAYESMGVAITGRFVIEL